MLAQPPARHGETGLRSENVALVDLLDRLLAGGVVIAGDVVIAISDVDLVRVSLRALICSVGGVEGRPDAGEPARRAD